MLPIGLCSRSAGVKGYIIEILARVSKGEDILLLSNGSCLLIVDLLFFNLGYLKQSDSRRLITTTGGVTKFAKESLLKPKLVIVSFEIFFGLVVVLTLFTKGLPRFPAVRL